MGKEISNIDFIDFCCKGSKFTTNNQIFEEKNNYFTIIFPQNDGSTYYFMYQIL